MSSLKQLQEATARNRAEVDAQWDGIAAATVTQQLNHVARKTNGNVEAMLPIDGLIVRVRMLDVRRVFNRIDVLVTPIGGAGQKWVDNDRLNPV